MHHPFPPFYNTDSKILILGSFPSVASRMGGFYYHHPHNRFWKVISSLTHASLPNTIEEKKDLLSKHKIALWDVIDSCERKGSLDSEIKNEEANQIEELLEDYPNIKAIFCNGGKSYKNLQKILGKNYKIPVFLLPSTSPLHTVSFEKKLEEWKKIKMYL